MKKIIYFLTLIVLFSCTSTKELIKSGNYDSAIDKLIKSVEKSPLKINKIQQLKTAFSDANTRDNDEIEKLKLGGKPNIWYEIYFLYVKLEKRQSKIQPLPTEVKDSINFSPEDYQKSLNKSKEKAASYFYASAKKCLKTNSVEDQTLAYKNLLKIKELYQEFRDVDELLEKFKTVEPDIIFYRVKDKSPNYLPSSIEDELTNIDLSDLNSPLYTFINKKPSGKDYKYFIKIIITGIKISPEKTDKLYYTETVDVQDGIAYKLDNDGNFVLDTAGNKIEFPKFKTIACYVTEKRQKKAMKIIGTIEVYDTKSDESLSKISVSAETKFNHRSASFKGDLNALSPETSELIGSKTLDFPSDIEMLIRASDKFKVKVKKALLKELSALNSSE